MITKLTKSNIKKILYIINDAALKYKGIIPYNCWKEPYMSEEELLSEFSKDVKMFGFKMNNNLVGVMGIQKLVDVTLIRHAYILTEHQRVGIGKTLLQYLLRNHKDTCLLVGTWCDATWAIQFYKKFGFILHTKYQSALLLKKYWKISSKQIKNSIVLEKF